MSSPTTQKPVVKSKYVAVPDLGLDCPNTACSGWLVGFKKPEEASTAPAYIKCSNEGCLQKVMLSKFESRCSVCRKNI